MPTNSTPTPSNGQVQTRTRQPNRRRQQQTPANNQTNANRLAAEADTLLPDERVSIAELERRAAANNPPPATRNSQTTPKGQGPRVGDLFPTRWIHPDDLQGKTVNVFIEKVTVEKLWSTFEKQNVEKIVLFFHGKTKQLPLNVTQAQALVAITETDFVMDWTGHGCRLRAATARNGKPTIEILPPLPAQTTTNHAPAAAAVAADAAAAGVAPAAPAASEGEFGSTDLPDDEPAAEEEFPELEYIDEDDANALFGS